MHHPLITLAQRLRRNHALEHATLHLLAASAVAAPRSVAPRLVARTDWSGFWLYGQVPTGQVLAAAQEALARLQGHDEALAVHRRCGTNITAGLLVAGALGYATSRIPARRRHARALALLAAAFGGCWLATPLGLWAQRHVTTDPRVGDARIGAIDRSERTSPLGAYAAAPLVVHHVLVTHRRG
jgi:hypothetical protein